MRRFWAATIAAACVSCVSQGQISIPLESRRTSEIPAAYQKIALRGVYGNDQTDLGSYRLPRPMTKILEDAMRERLGPNAGSGANANGAIPLVIENVNWAVGAPAADAAIGIGADFVLGTSPKPTRIRLEHSINAPVGGEEILRSMLARAVADLTDRFFFHPQALAAVGAAGESPRDSAFVDEPVKEVGPIAATKSSASGVESSGRILWGSSGRQSQGQVSVLLGDSKGAVITYGQRATNRFAGYRYNLGVMAVEAGGSFAFATIVGIAGELGYNATKHDDRGYVIAPGVAFAIVPTISALNLFVPDSDAQITTISMGGNVELDLPIGSILGIRGGGFFGTALYSVRLGSYSDADFTDFIAYPFGDIYLQTSTGRMSLGLTFQQLSQGPDGIENMFENPTITLTYESEAGRGVAYSKESLELPGWTFTDQSVKSSPQSAFLAEGAVKATAPPSSAVANQMLAGGAGGAGGAAGGAGATTQVTPAQAPFLAAAARTSSAAKQLWVLAARDPDAELGAEAKYAVRAVLEEIIRDASGEVVTPAEEQRLRAARKLADTPEASLAIASAASARFVLYYTVTVLKEDVLVRLERIEAGSKETVLRQKLVARAAMLDAVRAEAKALLGQR